MGGVNIGSQNAQNIHNISGGDITIGTGNIKTPKEFFRELQPLLQKHGVDIQSISSTGSSILVNSKYWKSVQIDGTSSDANLNVETCRNYL